MNTVFILDACALIASLANENGAHVVADLLKRASVNEIAVKMNKVNLLEVYYNVFREYGKVPADDFLSEVDKSPIEIVHEISNDVFTEAGRLKASYKVSLADTIALAEASVSGGTLVTSDHHEFDVIEKKEPIQFLWIR